MAFTIVGVERTTPEQRNTSELFISEEYLPHKECDDTGNVLPGQDWQHPPLEDLHYCRVGTMVTDARAWELIRIVLEQGARELGGHARVIMTEQGSWLRGKIETWSKRAERERLQREEDERQERLKREAEEPSYAFCPRCGETTECCKDPRHRGPNPCMRCGGGFGGRSPRRCVNCYDLAWREKRENAIGHEIVYLNEE